MNKGLCIYFPHIFCTADHPADQFLLSIPFLYKWQGGKLRGRRGRIFPGLAALSRTRKTKQCIKNIIFRQIFEKIISNLSMQSQILV